MVADSPQRVNKEQLERMEKIGLFSGRHSSFKKSLEDILSFCEKNKKEFEKWKNNQKTIKS